MLLLKTSFTVGKYSNKFDWTWGWWRTKRSESSIDLNYFHKNYQIKTTNQDADSLHIENLQRLSTMKNLIFLDLDNFSSFFEHLTDQLPDQTSIMAFQGSNIRWKPPEKYYSLLLFDRI